MGNHEFYKYYDIATLANGYCLEIRHNVHSYYNDTIHLDDTDIIVSTLWGHIPLQEAYFTESVISDFRRILYKGEKWFFRNLVEAQVAEDHFSFEQVKRCSPKHYSLYSF